MTFHRQILARLLGSSAGICLLSTWGAGVEAHPVYLAAGVPRLTELRQAVKVAGLQRLPPAIRTADLIQQHSSVVASTNRTDQGLQRLPRLVCKVVKVNGRSKSVQRLREARKWVHRRQSAHGLDAQAKDTRAYDASAVANPPRRRKQINNRVALRSLKRSHSLAYVCTWTAKRSVWGKSLANLSTRSNKAVAHQTTKPPRSAHSVDRREMGAPNGLALSHARPTGRGGAQQRLASSASRAITGHTAKRSSISKLAGTDKVAIISEDNLIPTSLRSAAAAAASPAHSVTPPTQNGMARVNQTVTINVPVKEHGVTIGEISLTISGRKELSVPAAELVALLGPRISSSERSRMLSVANKAGHVQLEYVNQGPTKLTFDDQTMELLLAMADAIEKPAALSVAPLSRQIGEPQQASDDPSFYVTLRGAVDYLRQGSQGRLVPPAVGAQFALRAGGIVLEDEHQYLPGRAAPPLLRIGSRAVIDFAKQDIRVVVGDTQNQRSGFQQTINILGVNVGRFYRIFDPSRNIFPSTLDSFVVNRASNIEVVVNGTIVKRIALNPGRYNLEDFPFVRGNNDVQIRSVDMVGRTELARFSRYFDLDLLRPGLAEFGVTSGFISTPGITGPVYDFRRPFSSGFIRKGITSQLTLGLNYQMDKRARQIGTQAVLATPIGLVGLTGAVSQTQHLGVGGAFRVDLQRVNPFAHSGEFNTISATAEYRTRNFTIPNGYLSGPDLLTWRLTSNASVRISKSSQLSVTLGAAQFRDAPLALDLGGRYNFSLTNSATLGVGVSYRSGGLGRSGLSALASFSARLGGRGFVSSSIDTRERTGSISYSEASPQIVGATATRFVAAWNDDIGSVSGNLDLITNRADIGLAQVLDFDVKSGSFRRSLTSIRGATSIAFAGGALAFGRPIRDAFAIVTRHETLKQTKINIDPQFEGVRARTDIFGNALVSDIGSYNDRTIVIDAPDAPSGYDLGSGTFKIRAPYKAGYRIQLGTDYSTSAVGVLRDRLGQPLSLAIGSVKSLDEPDLPSREVFTNSTGRLVVGSLRPGRWLLTFGDDDVLEYELVIPLGQADVFNFNMLDPK